MKDINVALRKEETEDLSKYINIPGTDIAISCFEPAYTSQPEVGYKWNEAHFAIAEATKGKCWMPAIWRFMPHLVNVISAQKGKEPAFDGNGNPLDKLVLEEAYKYRTSGFKGGAWSWLNGIFVPNKEGFKKLGIKYVAQINLQDKSLEFKEIPLEECVFENCYVELDGLNSQGLPTKKSRVQQYSAGDNIGYENPLDGSVARFIAGSDGADLSCGWGPGCWIPSLRVFACAEGAAPKNPAGAK